MRASRATITALASVGLLAGAGLARAGEGAVPTFPPGKDFKAPRPAKMPGTILEWRAVIAHAEAPVFKSFEGDAPLGAAKLKFGELAYVVDSQEPAGKPPRLLLARFEDGEKFQGWIGWVDANSVIDRPQPLKVHDAREYLRKAVAKDHPLYERIHQVLLDASNEDFKNVTLKAVTFLERGRACFSRPVPPAEYELASKTADAAALQPFAFVYVYGFAVDARNVYCLVGPRSEITLEKADPGDKFRQQLTGWVDFESLVLWTTRMAFEFNLQKPALEYRRKSNRPIELYSRKNDLLDWAKWEQGGRKGDNPAKPVFVEELDPERALPHMCMPWNPRVMRFPILSCFPLRDPAKKPAGFPGKWEGFRLGVFSNATHGGTAYDVEEMKRKLTDAVMDLRVFELVLVLDATGSNGPAISATKDAVVKMVEELKKEAAGQKDELEKIQLRVAVVLYKDFADQDADYLTKESDDFFDVMTDKGLTDFKEWIDDKDREARGGGDELEEPFEGIDKAVKKFLAPEGSKHAPGAARLVMVIGDSGNHDVGGNTKLSFENVLKSLDPVGETTIDKQKKAVAKIQLHSVMTLWSYHDLKKERVGQKKWEAQIHALADKTGGAKHEVAFHDADAKKASTDKLAAVLKTALDARRSLMRAELVQIRDLFGVTADRDSGAGGAEQVLARDRLKEILKGKGELDKLLKGLSRTSYTEVFAVRQIPEEPEVLARLKLCILVSEREYLRLIASTQSMAEGLDEIVKKGGLGGGGEALEAKIKRLIVTTMLNAFGEDATPARIEGLMKKTLPQIQREVSQLPVQFGILKTQPKTEEDLKKMVEVLKIKASRPFMTSTDMRPYRFFSPGVATGERYIWLYESELP